jgi:hypothetical protein
MQRELLKASASSTVTQPLHAFQTWSQCLPPGHDGSFKYDSEKSFCATLFNVLHTNYTILYGDLSDTRRRNTTISKVRPMPYTALQSNAQDRAINGAKQHLPFKVILPFQIFALQHPQTLSVLQRRLIIQHVHAIAIEDPTGTHRYSCDPSFDFGLPEGIEQLVMKAQLAEQNQLTLLHKREATVIYQGFSDATPSKTLCY